ncbi:hypothetical protein [Amycolatopsis echigonensis]|uniref:Uncharacterized protein n=1 Tax=Amycolatopsis echigonensis TaxID=2576905 RepID=A0A2N3X0B6_9PSEU|nr:MULTISPECIES: hypothetical protein [Amycolatopsis]MBB2501223.1 hypothetical protein [Amycolatopsis echigonensis]PKV99557.1 hypothetical protein ATK30_0535 [Amycolatopsis niigatensis]
MDSVKFEELDALAAEVLPERAVLGIVSTPFNNAGGGANGSASSSSAAASGGNTVVYDGGHHGATALSACQSSHSEGTPGLTGTLGLGSNNPNETMSCTPAAVSSY